MVILQKPKAYSPIELIESGIVIEPIVQPANKNGGIDVTSSPKNTSDILVP